MTGNNLFDLTQRVPSADLRVTVVSAVAGQYRGMVEAEGFEFDFSAEASGADVWVSFVRRVGTAGEVFTRRETEIRAAARAALRSRHAA